MAEFPSRWYLHWNHCLFVYFLIIFYLILFWGNLLCVSEWAPLINRWWRHFSFTQTKKWWWFIDTWDEFEVLEVTLAVQIHNVACAEWQQLRCQWTLSMTVSTNSVLRHSDREPIVHSDLLNLIKRENLLLYLCLHILYVVQHALDSGVHIDEWYESTHDPPAAQEHTSNTWDIKKHIMARRHAYASLAEPE